MPSPPTPQIATRPCADRRVRTLFAAAAPHLGPGQVQGWIFAPHQSADGLEPAVLVWYSDRLLGLALRLLQREQGEAYGRRRLD